MPVGRLILKHGVEPDRAAKVLRDLVQQGGNVPSAGPGTMRLRDAYLNWVDAAEAQLASLTHDAAIVTMFNTPRYWHIRQLGLDGLPEVHLDRTARAWPIVRAETEFQNGVLIALAEDLDERLHRADGARGPMTVLDTNVLLHHQRPDSVPWPTVLNVAAVRLVVPLRVVEELDAKKYSRADLADRARALLPWLEEAVAKGPCKIADSTTIEVLVDRHRHLRPQDADREILDACHELREFSGQHVTLVTADTAMLLRARAEGIAAQRMPPGYERVGTANATASR